MKKLPLLLAFSAALAAGSLLRVRAGEPNFARTFYERGLNHARYHRYADALDDYSRAIKLDPKFVDAYFSRSSVYASDLPIVERDYAKAAADLTSILEIVPRDFSARFNRALCYEQLRQYDEAIGDYSTIIEEGADFSRVAEKTACLVHAYRNRGRAYQWYKKDYAKAVADYNEALRLNPNADMVRYRRGQSYNALAEYAKAESDFRAALARDPQYPNLLAAYAWQLAACPDAKFRDGKQAAELARRANQSSGFTVPDYLEGLAAARAENGEFDEAVKWQKKALEQTSFDSPAPRETRQAMERRLKLYEAGKPYRTP